VEDYALEVVEGDEGSVTIVKEATPEDSTTFWFCTQLSSGFFHLFCDFLQDPVKDTLIVLNPDQVLDITESAVPDWTLTDITITGDTDNGSTIDVANKRVNLDFDPGEHIVITFKNQKITDDEHLDFGDAPDPAYPTLLVSNGARHTISPGLYLGSGIDPEADGQPSAKADGDDQNTFYPGAPFPPGDEDGVLLPSVITAGQSFTIQVTSSGTGVLNAWLDFNIDGDWADAGEHRRGLGGCRRTHDPGHARKRGVEYLHGHCTGRRTGRSVLCTVPFKLRAGYKLRWPGTGWRSGRLCHRDITGRWRQHHHHEGCYAKR
jgi:hypothetical protein